MSEEKLTVDLSELAMALSVAGLAMVAAEDVSTGMNIREVLEGKHGDEAKLEGPYVLTMPQLSAITITILMAALARSGVPRGACVIVGAGVVETLRDKVVMENLDRAVAEHKARLN